MICGCGTGAHERRTSAASYLRQRNTRSASAGVTARPNTSAGLRPQGCSVRAKPRYRTLHLGCLAEKDRQRFKYRVGINTAVGLKAQASAQ
jgi:hypothetical protein